jgi:hypothetical protein
VNAARGRAGNCLPGFAGARPLCFLLGVEIEALRSYESRGQDCAAFEVRAEIPGGSICARVVIAAEASETTIVIKVR